MTESLAIHLKLTQHCLSTTLQYNFFLIAELVKWAETGKVKSLARNMISKPLGISKDFYIFCCSFSIGRSFFIAGFPSSIC